VVGEDGDKLLLVSGLSNLNRACRQLGEGVIGWGENRERPLALKRFHQPAALTAATGF